MSGTSTPTTTLAIEDGDENRIVAVVTGANR